MKEIRLPDRLKINILRPEAVICPRIVQKNPVCSRRGDHHRIGSTAVFRQNHILFRPVFLKSSKNNPSEFVIPDLSHKPDIRSQHLQSQSGIGHSTSGADIDVPHLHQLTGNQHLLQRLRFFRQKNRSNIQTDMAGHNNFFSHIKPFPHFRRRAFFSWFPVLPPP